MCNRRKTFQVEDRLPFTSEYMLMEPDFMRSVLPHGDIMTWDFSTGRMLHLMVQSKKALLTQQIGRKRSKRLFNRLEWIRRLHEEDAEFIGQEEIDGIMTNIFVNEIPFEKTTVWVDPETNLPVQVKMDAQKRQENKS